MLLHAINIQTTITAHTPRRAPQLHANHNQAHHPQHEEDERAHDDDPWEELPLGD